MRFDYHRAMPHSTELITTIAASLGLAMIMGFLAARIKIPPMAGYLLAGIIIGPATPGFVADIGLARQLADIGVMLLMFGSGFTFRSTTCWRCAGSWCPGGRADVPLGGPGHRSSAVLGMGPEAAVVFGLALSVASTVVVLRSLEASHALQSINGRIAIGWLIVEDLVMVLVLVLLPPAGQMLGGSQPSPRQSPRWANCGSRSRLRWARSWPLSRSCCWWAVASCREYSCSCRVQGRGNCSPCA
jgi:CPA2 family monovalent cation:H+ antiporter-2